jgi:hypothetical protein
VAATLRVMGNGSSSGTEGFYSILTGTTAPFQRTPVRTGSNSPGVIYHSATPSSATATAVSFWVSPTSGGIHSFRLQYDAATQLLSITMVIDGTSSYVRAAAQGASNIDGSGLYQLDAWHKVDAYWYGTNQIKVWVDGVLEIDGTFTGATYSWSFGTAYASFNSTGSYTGISDVALWSGWDGVLPKTYQVFILKAISDQTRGTWTGGVGGTSNLFEAINNYPPVGSDSETDITQIENATNTANQDFVFNCSTYASVGIEDPTQILWVQPFCIHGEDANTGTKTGNLWVSSNPTSSIDSNYQFTFGSDAGALLVYPSYWAPWSGPAVAGSSSINVYSSPQVTIRAVSATTRVRSICCAGLYVMAQVDHYRQIHTPNYMQVLPH